VESLAKDLLGKIIVSKIDKQYCAVKITETEAYRGPEDKASHAYNNKLTNRTRPMFFDGGIAYVYLCYGIHRLFNVVSGPENMPHAILIRAGEPIEGIGIMKERRKSRDQITTLTIGPGNLSVALGIQLNHNYLPLFDSQSDIVIEDWGFSCISENIMSGPRVGIDYSEEWKDIPWRFRLSGNIFIGRN
jgi:DNA-3-methyladenine glycosylase